MYLFFWQQLVENKLLLLIIDSNNNKRYIDCIKYLNLNKIKVIIIHEHSLTRDNYLNIIKCLESKNQLDATALYETNEKIIFVDYNYFLNVLNYIELQESCQLRNLNILKNKMTNIYGQQLNVLIIDSVKNELLIGNEILKYEDDRSLETAIQSINGTVNYLQWKALNKFGGRTLDRYVLQRFNIITILGSQKSIDSMQLFESTYPYEMEFMTLIVPKSKPMSLEETLMDMYSQELWMIFVLYSKVYGFVWVVIRFVTKQPWKSLYCYDFNILYDPTYTRIKKTSCEYLLMLSAMWFTFFAFAGFQVIIITAITSVKFLPQIQSLPEICKSDLSILTFDNDLKNILVTYETICPKLSTILKPMNTQDESMIINELFLNVNDYNTTAFLLDQNQAKLIVTSRFNRKDGK